MYFNIADKGPSVFFNVTQISRLTILILSLVFFSLTLQAQESLEPDSKEFKFWNDFETGSVMNVNHEQWQIILTKYVDDQHPSGINRFDYAAVSSEDKDLLKSYLDYLQLLEPRQLNQAEAKAYWLNLYNAILVDDILDAFEIDEITSVRQIRSGAFKAWPWTRNAVEVLTKKISLSDIEHNIIRPMFQDPRVHFVMAKGSLGGANLLKTAFDGENNEELLDQAEQDFLNHPRGVDTSNGLELSSIFEWYRSDFGGNQEAVIAYIQERLSSEDETTLPQTNNINYDYNWSINAPE